MYARPYLLAFASLIPLCALLNHPFESSHYLNLSLQIVFKALIVLHTMIRNGSTDNVLSYLSSSEVLRLRDISSGNWGGQLARILTFDDIRLKVMIIAL